MHNPVAAHGSLSCMPVHAQLMLICSSAGSAYIFVLRPLCWHQENFIERFQILRINRLLCTSLCPPPPTINTEKNDRVKHYHCILMCYLLSIHQVHTAVQFALQKVTQSGESCRRLCEIRPVSSCCRRIVFESLLVSFIPLKLMTAFDFNIFEIN